MVGRAACKQALEHWVWRDSGRNTKMIAMQALQERAACHAWQHKEGWPHLSSCAVASASCRWCSSASFLIRSSAARTAAFRASNREFADSKSALNCIGHVQLWPSSGQAEHLRGNIALAAGCMQVPQLFIMPQGGPSRCSTSLQQHAVSTLHEDVRPTLKQVREHFPEREH